MAEIRHNQGEAGGYLVGNRHSEGGIKAVNKSTGQPLEMEGGEVVITRDAVSDPKKRSFNGKMMTNRQILSEINQSGGGVAFADGGDVPESMHFDADAEYEYGGDTMCGCDLATRMSSAKSYEDGGQADDDKYMALKVGFLFEVEYIGYKYVDGKDTIAPNTAKIRGDVGTLIDFIASANNEIKLFNERGDTTYTPESATFKCKLIINEKQLNLITGAAMQDDDTIQFDLFQYVSYEDFFKSNYVEVLDGILRTLRATDMHDYADLYFQQNELYFLGIEIDRLRFVDKNLFIRDDKYYHDFESALPNLFSKIDLSNNLFGISDIQDSARFVAELKQKGDVNISQWAMPLPKQNYKEFTKAIKRAVKESNIPAKDIKGVMIEGKSFIVSGFKNLSTKVDFYIDFSKLTMKPTWSWWKENVFQKAPLEFRNKDNRDNATSMLLGKDALNFLAYEQDGAFSFSKTRNDNTREKLAKDLRESVKDLPKLPALTSISRWNRYGDIMETRGAHIVFIPKAELQIRKPYKAALEFYFLSQMQAAQSKALIPFGSINDLADDKYELQYNAIDPAIKRSAVYYGKDGVWAFEFNDTIHPSKYERRDKLPNLDLVRAAYFKADEEALAKMAEKQRLEKERLDAEKKAARDAAKAEKQRIEDIKNRPYGVRDQPEDFKFLPFDEDNQYLDSETEEKMLALKNEEQALLKMLTMATGIRNFDMRKAILKKLTKTREGLEQIRLKDNFAVVNVEGTDAEKLMTPKGLMDYYFNQARQSPVKAMGDACGLDTPTGVPSKLSLQAYYSVRTPYFKRWFGDWEEAAATGDYSDCSKMVDPETKEPRIMYHGVRRFSALVDVANMGKGVVRPYGEFKSPFFPASYFGSDLSYVAFYAGMAENQYHPEPDYEGFIYHVFLNLRNPVVLDYFKVKKLSYTDLLAYIAFNYGIVIKPSQNVLDLIANGYKGRDVRVWNYIRNDINLIAELKKAGFDGIIQMGNVPTFDETGAQAEDALGDEYLTFNANQVKSAVVKNSFYIPLMDDIRFKSGGYVRI